MSIPGEDKLAAWHQRLCGLRWRAAFVSAIKCLLSSVVVIPRSRKRPSCQVWQQSHPGSSSRRAAGVESDAKRLSADPKVSVLWHHVVEEAIGTTSLQAVRVRNVQSGEAHVIDCRGLFYAIGHVPNTEFSAVSSRWMKPVTS